MGKTAVLSVKILGDSRDAQKAMQATEQSAGRLSKLGGLAKGALVGAAAGAGALAVKLGVDAVRSASDLEQSVGGVEAVFKGGAGGMLEFSKTAATSVGLSSAEFNRLGTILGAQLKNGGTSITELGGKTTDLIKVGADLSAMFGGSATEAVEAISSALKNERDPIERYGISLTQAKVDAEAAALGFKKVGGSFDQQAQQAATMSLIMKQSGDAAGAFGRETNTLAHQQQVLTAQWTNLTATIGTMFLPVLTRAMGWLNAQGVPMLERFVASLRTGQGPPAAFAAAIRGAFAQIGPAVGPALASARQLAPALGQALASAAPMAVSALNGLAGAFTFLSQHTGVLKVALGGIVAALALHRAGAAASQVVEAARLPITIAQVGATIALAAANRQLAASQVAVSAQNTAAAAAQTRVVAAENAGILARARGVAGMVAQRVAMTASAAASRTMAVAQMALNAVMAANPIALVVIAVAALVAGFVVAYHKVAWFRSGVNAVFSWLRSAVPAALKVVGLALLGPFVGAFVVAYQKVEWFRNGVNAVLRFVRALATSFASGVRSVITGGLGAAATAGVAAFNRLRSLGSSAITGLRSSVASGVAAARSSVTSALGAAASTGAAALGRLRSLGSSAITGLRSAVASGARGALSAVSSMGRGMVTAMSYVPGQMLGMGRAVVQGLINGIRSMGGAASGAIRGVVSGAVTSAKRALGIRSPSRVFAELGKFTGQGFVLGLERQASAVQSATADMLGQPAAIAASAPAVAGRGGPIISVTVHGALDPNETARRVRQVITKDRARDGATTWGVQR